MAIQHDSIVCPICEDTTGIAEVEIDPGEREITSGPSDNWHPGSPPSIDSVGEIEWCCSCRDNLETMLRNYPRKDVVIAAVMALYDLMAKDSVQIEDLDLSGPEPEYEPDDEWY